jgi:hypothetical protein
MFPFITSNTIIFIEKWYFLRSFIQQKKNKLISSKKKENYILFMDEK